MAKKETTPQSLYESGREFLREQIRTNELLADIAGVEYTPPEGVPKGKYMENKWLLDAAEKKNELLGEIAETGGVAGGANKLAIDYETDILSLKKGGNPIPDSGVTLPAYGINFDPTTGGLTLTKNGTAMSGQTVTIPNYGSPVAVEDSANMTDHDVIYLYEGTTGATYTNGHFYYWDGAAWADGGEYAAATVQTDKTLLVEDAAADAKATGDAVAELKTQLNDIDDVIYPNEPVLIKISEDFALTSRVIYWDIGRSLDIGKKYRIDFSVTDSLRLAAIQTTYGTSGSTVVENITSEFVGESWQTGKTAIIIPEVSNIHYIQIQFNSSYQNDQSCNIAVYDISELDHSVIERIDVDIALINNEIESLYDLQNHVDINRDYNLLPPDGYTVDKEVDRGTGELINSTGKVASDYVEIDPTQGYISNYAKTASIKFDPISGESDSGNFNTFDRFAYAFYDENKIYIPYVSGASDVSKQIPENAKYIRVTIQSEELYPLARLIYGNYQTQPIIRIVQYKKIPPKPYIKANTGFENFKMVMFGDSITHGSLSTGNDGTSYTDYASDYLNSNIVNVGFGGTRATYTLSGAGLFCFYHLCECIVSEDANAWDDLLDYATNQNTTYLPHLQKLMNMDWENVNAIGLMYGANDYTSNTPVGNAYNETTSNYDGAIAYGLKLLQTKYPHLQVLIISPFDREMTAGDPSTMTDRAQNTAGLLMSDYAKSLENVVERFHCPLIDTGKLFGINQYNILLYASDGTHPRANIAQFRLGWLFAEAVKTHLSPI